MSYNPEIMKEKIDKFEHMEIKTCLAKPMNNKNNNNNNKKQDCCKQRQMPNDKCGKMLTICHRKKVILPLFKEILRNQ